MPKRFRNRPGSRHVKIIMREDGVISVHSVYDPLKLKGSVRYRLDLLR